MTVQGKALALFALDGRIVATDAECPHEGAPLHEGTVEEGCIVCPWHAYRFELTSGRCHSDPNLSVKTYSTIVQEGAVFVDLAG